jgi:hypothetical protein
MREKLFLKGLFNEKTIRPTQAVNARDLLHGNVFSKADHKMPAPAESQNRKPDPVLK